MPINITVNGTHMTIASEAIDADIARLEERSEKGEYDKGVYRAPRPNIHGFLACMRDNRGYDPIQIEEVCMGICPFYDSSRKSADDGPHLDDCRLVLFEGTNLDGKIRYMSPRK